MSFVQATYVKAMAAIEAGDEARVMKLIRRPVEARQVKARGQLQRLIYATARQGLGQAAEHLVRLLPSAWQHEGRLSVWALALEAGHTRLAEQWKANHPDVGASWGEQYAEALCRNAWQAVLTVLDEHPEIEAVRANWTVRHMQQQNLEPVPDACGQVLRRVAAQADDGMWWGVVTLAMRMGDDALLETYFPNDGADTRRNHADLLWREALRCQRYDWVERVERQFGFHPAASFWATRLAECLKEGRNAIVDEVVQRRPEVVDKLQDRHHRHSWHEMVRALLLQVANDRGLLVEPSHGKIWDRLTDHITPATVRQDIVTRQDLNPDDLHSVLNAMAMLVSPDVGQAWAEAEPDVFNLATARLRERQALGHAPATSARRHRHRA